MVRSAEPTHPDLERSSGPFAAQLALASVHPALAPMRAAGAGYVLDSSKTAAWFALAKGRGFAGYGLARALRMLLDVLAGLTALHDTQTGGDEGFVHGEVAPGLLRVDAQGIARLQPLAPWHWQTSAAPMSPENVGHLAPERLLGDAIDCRADVYSAGVLLWEALAGKRLFERDSADEIIMRLMGRKVLLPELPPELAWAIPLKAVAMRALSVDPAQRFRDCPELAAAIEAVTRGRVASHAMVAAHFAAPARAYTSLPPPLPRVPSLEEAFRATHKSSLSALVAPSVPLPPARLVSDTAPPAKRARRGGWMAAALVSVAVALGIAGFVRRTQTYTPARAAAALGAPSAPMVSAPPSADPAPPAAMHDVSAPDPSGSVAPPEAGSTPAPGGSVAPEAGHSAAKRLGRPARTPPAARDGKAHAPVKPGSPAPPAKPAGVRDNEAEQYGI